MSVLQEVQIFLTFSFLRNFSVFSRYLPFSSHYEPTEGDSLLLFYEEIVKFSGVIN